jgi:glycosyltransferase involved in cell wall biosynthesis
MAEAMQQRGHHVHLVTYHLGEKIVVPNLRLHRISHGLGYRKISSGPSWGKLILNLLLALKLWQVVRQEAIQIIHAHNYEGLLVGWLAGCWTGLPVVYHSHNVMSHELHTYFRSALGQWAASHLARLLDRHLPRRADACIALSREAIYFFRQHGVTGPIALIPPGIDDAKPDVASHADIRARYNLGTDPLLIYTGNLDKYQSIKFLLRSFSLVLSSRPNVYLLIVSGSDPGEYQAQVEHLGIADRVRFIRPDSLAMVYALLDAADLAVCPRVACFGFPIKLLNYMVRGKAIVISAGSAKGITHLVNGYVVKNDGENAFAEAVVNLLDQPTLIPQLGERARTTVENYHHWPALARDIEVLYNIVVTNHLTQDPTSKVLGVNNQA